MKSRLLIALLLIGKITFCQDALNETKRKIDSLIVSYETNQETDSFDLSPSKHTDYSVKYIYNKRKGEIFKIFRHFTKDSIAYYQTFFIQEGHLVYFTEQMTSYSFERNKLDSASGYYFYIQDQIFEYKSEWKWNKKFVRKDHEKEIRKEFKESMDDIQRHNKTKNGN